MWVSNNHSVHEDHINNQRDATIFCSLLIAIVYMFRASLAHRQEFRKLCMELMV